MSILEGAVARDVQRSIAHGLARMYADYLPSWQQECSSADSIFHSQLERLKDVVDTEMEKLLKLTRLSAGDCAFVRHARVCQEVVNLLVADNNFTRGFIVDFMLIDEQRGKRQRVPVLPSAAVSVQPEVFDWYHRLREGRVLPSDAGMHSRYAIAMFLAAAASNKNNPAFWRVIRDIAGRVLPAIRDAAAAYC